MLIGITGAVGVGKTSLLKYLIETSVPYKTPSMFFSFLERNYFSLIFKNEFFDEPFVYFDFKRFVMNFVVENENEVIVVDVKKAKEGFVDLFEQFFKNLNPIVGEPLVFLESHLLVEENFNLDLLFVLRCSPLLILERLRKRNYSPKKAFDNALLEALDYFPTNARSFYRNVVEIDTTNKGLKQELEELAFIYKLFKEKREEFEKIKQRNFSFKKELEQLALLSPKFD